jgi:hypothetical protein
MFTPTIRDLADALIGPLNIKAEMVLVVADDKDPVTDNIELFMTAVSTPNKNKD